MIDKLFDTLRKIESFEKRERKTQKNRNTTGKIEKYTIWIMALLLLSLAALYAAREKIQNETLTQSVLIITTTLYVIAITAQIIIVLINAKIIWQSLETPITSAIDSHLNIPIQAEYKFINELIALPRNTLTVALSVLENERSYLQGRLNIIIGPSEKAGLFPGIIGLLAAILLKQEINDWGMLLALTNILMFLFAAYGLHLKHRYNRTIHLLQLALKQSKDNTPKNKNHH